MTDKKEKLTFRSKLYDIVIILNYYKDQTRVDILADDNYGNKLGSNVWTELSRLQILERLNGLSEIVSLETPEMVTDTFTELIDCYLE